MFRLNEAGWDRILRGLLGVVLLYLGWGGVVSGALATILKVLGFVSLITGIVGFCPIYGACRIRTNKA